VNRRDFLRKVAGTVTIGAGSGILTRFAWAEPVVKDLSELPEGARESASMAVLEDKAPLIKRTYRPPNFETPLKYFNEAFTPNEAFFVRYHLPSIPRVDAQAWTLKVGGDSVASPLEFTLHELKRNFEQVEIAAVNQCAGNRRGLVQPHAPGIQWGYGAMGNARWRGVRLKDVLKKAGIKENALEIVAHGADAGLIDKTPDFAKSLPIWKALDDNTLIAFAMNGAPLPHWHGFPARLIVPGWTATYWMKHVTSLNVVSKPFDGFWMKTAYRVPKGAFPGLEEFDSQSSEVNTPITEILVNSLITNIENGQTFNLGQPIKVKGIAWDGGHGIDRVELSIDQGKTWQRADLLEDYGRFSWRQWRYEFQSRNKGSLTLMARATNHKGTTQPVDWTPNPAGYHHNRIQNLKLVIA
jgi:DMSO/TMAO reductase YedYZ molybdopterin-dependent catalytic subunit